MGNSKLTACQHVVCTGGRNGEERTACIRDCTLLIQNPSVSVEQSLLVHGGRSLQLKLVSPKTWWNITSILCFGLCNLGTVAHVCLLASWQGHQNKVLNRKMSFPVPGWVEASYRVSKAGSKCGYGSSCWRFPFLWVFGRAIEERPTD